MARSPHPGGGRYVEQRGNHFAAAITFFSILTAVPLPWSRLRRRATSCGSIPHCSPNWRTASRPACPRAVPRPHPIIETAIGQRNTVAGVGLVAALWSGIWWMSNLREAVSAQWGLPPPHPAALQRLASTSPRWSASAAALVASLPSPSSGRASARPRCGFVGRRRRVDPHLSAGCRSRSACWRLADVPLGDHPAAPHGRPDAGAAGRPCWARWGSRPQAGRGDLPRVRDDLGERGRFGRCWACCSSPIWSPRSSSGSRPGRPPPAATSARPDPPPPAVVRQEIVVRTGRPGHRRCARHGDARGRAGRDVAARPPPRGSGPRSARGKPLNRGAGPERELLDATLLHDDRRCPRAPRSRGRGGRRAARRRRRGPRRRTARAARLGIERAHALASAVTNSELTTGPLA